MVYHEVSYSHSKFPPGTKVRISEKFSNSLAAGKTGVAREGTYDLRCVMYIPTQEELEKYVPLNIQIENSPFPFLIPVEMVTAIGE